MTETRRKFRREGEAQRRDDLIAAALELIAEGGLSMATVRAIAARAGVTPGLIRHYFNTKEDLIAASYESLMDQITDVDPPLADMAEMSALLRLAALVQRSVTPPVVDPRRVALWAGFIHMVRNDPSMHAIHTRTYLGFRNRLEALIDEVLCDQGHPASAEDLRALAIACNAVLDGLWLEGSALPEAFEPDEIPRIALASVGAILGVELPFNRLEPR